jgi:hypothetical protein
MALIDGDLSDPMQWITAGRVADIAGVAVGAPELVATDETLGIRFTAHDERGDWSFELHMVNEDVIEAHGGRPGEWIAQRVAQHNEHHPVATFGDQCVVASDGRSEGWCYVAVADSTMMASAQMPEGSAARTCELLLRAVYDWPDRTG